MTENENNKIKKKKKKKKKKRRDIKNNEAPSLRLPDHPSTGSSFYPRIWIWTLVPASFAWLSWINEDKMIYKLASKRTSLTQSAIIDLETNQSSTFRRSGWKQKSQRDFFNRLIASKIRNS